MSPQGGRFGIAALREPVGRERDGVQIRRYPCPAAASARPAPRPAPFREPQDRVHHARREPLASRAQRGPAPSPPAPHAHGRRHARRPRGCAVRGTPVRWRNGRAAAVRRGRAERVGRVGRIRGEGQRGGPRHRRNRARSTRHGGSCAAAWSARPVQRRARCARRAAQPWPRHTSPSRPAGHATAREGPAILRATRSVRAGKAHA